MRFVIIALFALTLTGCKTLDQITKAAHDLIDIAGKVYEDGKESVEAVKKAIDGEPTK